MKLDSDTINELVELLTPLLEFEQSRRPLLVLALGNDAPVLRRITWSGAVANFIPEMVCQLADYGEVEPGRQALWALLEYISSQELVGVDVQQRIDKLCPPIDLRTSSFAPTDMLSRAQVQPKRKVSDTAYGNRHTNQEVSTLHATEAVDVPEKEVLKPSSLSAKELYYQAQDIKDKNKKQAINLLGQAIDLSPTYYLAYYERGIIYSEQREYHKAIEDFDRAEGLSSKDYNLYFKRAIARKSSRDQKGAINDYERVIELNPYEYKSYNNIGAIYAEQGDYLRAVEYFNKGIQAAPTHASLFRLNLVKAYTKAGNIRDAINICKQHIDQGNRDSDAYFYRGVLYDRIGETDQAIQDLEQASSLYANNKWTTEKALKTKDIIKEIQNFGHIRKMPNPSWTTWL